LLRNDHDKEDAQHIMKAAEFIGHEIKENTELAEHETGINNIKSNLYLIE